MIGHKRSLASFLGQPAMIRETLGVNYISNVPSTLIYSIPKLANALVDVIDHQIRLAQEGITPFVTIRQLLMSPEFKNNKSKLARYLRINRII